MIPALEIQLWVCIECANPADFFIYFHHFEPVTFIFVVQIWSIFT